jgi:hypothetical protein
LLANNLKEARRNVRISGSVGWKNSKNFRRNESRNARTLKELPNQLSHQLPISFPTHSNQPEVFRENKSSNLSIVSQSNHPTNRKSLSQRSTPHQNPPIKVSHFVSLSSIAKKFINFDSSRNGQFLIRQSLCNDFHRQKAVDSDIADNYSSIIRFSHFGFKRLQSS